MSMIPTDLADQLAAARVAQASEQTGTPPKKTSCVDVMDCAMKGPTPISSRELDISARSMSEARETGIKRGGARPGAGRPAATSERPWQVEGISRATYYRRQTPHQPDRARYTTAEPHWCVFSTFGQAEIWATAELSRAGYEAYLPLTAIQRRDPVIKSHFHVVRVPLFPGYGFIRLAATESREPIMATRGVREVLRRPDGHPAWLRDQVIDSLREGDEARLMLPKETGTVLKCGIVVRIEEGAFAGFAGVVAECDGFRTCVEIDLFGRLTPMWLDRTSVRE